MTNMKRSWYNQDMKNRGFSLVELLVATALFTIVVAVSAGSFLSILEASRQSRELNSLMRDVDFAMEDMSRTIRTGSGFPVGNYPKSSLAFTDENGKTVEYRLNNQKIEKRVDGSYGFSPLTSEDIEVTKLTFNQKMSTPNQPRIIINVVGQLGDSPEDTFYLQTSVTQRALNF